MFLGRPYYNRKFGVEGFGIPGWVRARWGLLAEHVLFDALDFDRIYYVRDGNKQQIGSDSDYFSNSRASARWAKNASGVYVSAASGQTNIQPGKGALLAEARTNLVTNSQVINNWPTKSDLTILDNNVIAPDGATTGAFVTAGSAGTDTLTTNTCSVTASVTTAASIFLKKSGFQWLRLVYGDATGTDGFNQWVDLTNGALGTASNRGAGTKVSASITEVSGGWYWITLVGTLSTRTTATISVVSADGNGSATRVSGATYYVWQADINDNTTFMIPSYVVTTSSAAAVEADVRQLIGPAATAALAAKGAYFETDQIPSAANVLSRHILSGTTDGFFYYPFSSNNSVRNQFNSNVNAEATFGSGDVTGVVKSAYGFDAGGCSVIANGGSLSSNAQAGTFSGQANVYYGNRSAGGRALNGLARRMAFFDVDPTDAGLTA